MLNLSELLVQKTNRQLLCYCQDSVYVGTHDQLMRIPAQHCARHQTKMACVNAMDPYCGWNEHKERCMPPPNNDPLSSIWHQDATQCAILNMPGQSLITFTSIQNYNESCELK